MHWSQDSLLHKKVVSWETTPKKNKKNTLRETKIAMEYGPFEDVFPIENGDFSIAMLVF